MPLVYSEGPGASLGYAQKLITIEGEHDTVVAMFISSLNADKTPRENRFWSPNVWAENKRAADNWLSACGFAADLDWGHLEEVPGNDGRPRTRHVKLPLPPEVAQAIESEARAGAIPGNAFHLSPHGARTIGILAVQCHDRAAFEMAARVYETDVARWLAGHPEWTPGVGKPGFKLDPTVTRDKARYLWAPCSKVRSNNDDQFHERAAEVVLMRAEPLDIQTMLARAAPPPPDQEPTARTIPRSRTTVREAVEEFCADLGDIYRYLGGDHPHDECPMCHHRKCFNILPREAGALYDRWCCHSANHDADSGPHHGVMNDDGSRYTGDGLDLVLALEDLYSDIETPRARVHLLQERGYLTTREVEPANEPANPLFDCAVSFTADQLRQDPPRQEYIWQYRIPRGARIAGSLSAAGGTGKTSFLVGLAVARAHGRDFLGIKTRPGSTVFISAEEKAEDYWRKLKAWSLNDESFDYEAVARNILVIDVVGYGLKFGTVERGRYQTNRLDTNRLAEVIRAKAPEADLLVVETASRLGPDETNEGHAALVTACEELSGQVGATVLVVGHVSKAAARERTGDAYVGRGGSSLTDNGRFSLTLTKLPSEAGAQKKEVGRQVADSIADRLLIFKSPKVNAAKPQPPVLLECVGAGDWGLTLRPYNLQSNAEILDRLQDEQHNREVEMVCAFLIREAAAGKVHTTYTLKAQCSAVGVARASIDAVVERAKLAGRIKEGLPGPRGSLPQLVVVPNVEQGAAERGQGAAA